jgi:hypothetical protein
MLEPQAQFIDGVNRGIAAADRGDLIDHEEVVNRIDRLLQVRALKRMAFLPSGVCGPVECCEFRWLDWCCFSKLAYEV